jgi:hypothetical protein
MRKKERGKIRKRERQREYHHQEIRKAKRERDIMREWARED